MSHAQQYRIDAAVLRELTEQDTAWFAERHAELARWSEELREGRCG